MVVHFKVSRYNILLPQENGGIAVFNTMNGSLSQFEPHEAAEAHSILCSPSALVQPESQLTVAMANQGLLVPADLDERQRLIARKSAGIHDANRLDLVIMPTLDCNLRCVYCFEERRPVRMSGDTVASLLRFLEIEIPRFKGVLLHWYGGEPLLECSTVAQVTKRAIEIAEASGSQITAQVTTNGYAMGLNQVAQLIQAGIREFQVTIDGSRLSHDRLRPHRSGGPTYDRIVGNTKGLLAYHPEVQVTIRVNFNRENVTEIQSLFETFPAEIRSRMRFVFEPVFGSCEVRARGQIDDATISATISTLHEQAAQVGYASSVSGIHAGKLVYCYSERQNQYIISPSGRVFKCAVGHFRDDEAVGILRKNGSVERFEAWNHWTGGPELVESCLDCAYAPLCMGGCRKERASSGLGGDTCALVPHNVSTVLKRIALEGENGLASLLGLTMDSIGGNDESSHSAKA